MTPQTIIRNLDTLKSERSLLDRKYEEISSFACPEKCNSFFGADPQEGESRPPQILIDNVSEANSIFARGLYAQLCPPGVQFFQYSPADEKLAKISSVRNFFGSASTKVFELAAGSNFATEFSEALEDFGWAGIINLSVERDPMRVYKFRNYHVSQYYIQENSDKVIDTVYREFKLSARQIADTYNMPGDRIPEKIAADAKDDNIAIHGRKYTLINIVYPNKSIKVGEDGRAELGNSNKPWKSVTVCRECPETIRDSGFDYPPYTVARYEKKANSMYGFSPGLRILRTAKLLNAVTRTLVKTAQKQIDPPVMLDSRAYKNTTPASFFNHPGAINYYDGSGNPPQFAPVPGNVAIGIDLMQKYENAINNAYMVNLFQMLQQLAENTNRDKTAFEVMQLVSEKHSLIIPVVSRILEEGLQPLFLKLFQIALDDGLLGELPAEFEGRLPAVSVKFDSPLALAAQRSKIKAVFDSVNQLAGLAQIDGGRCFDILNTDKIAEDIMESGGTDPAYLRSKSEIEQIRAERQQAMDQQAAQQQIVDLAKSQDLMKKAEAGSAMEAMTSAR